MNCSGFSAGKGWTGHGEAAAHLAFYKKMDGDFGEDLEQYPRGKPAMQNQWRL